MSPEDRRRVQESWAQAAEHADELAKAFYARLFDLDANTRRLFASTDMTQQRRKVTTTLTAVARMIDEPRQLVPIATALGRRHVDYGVQAADYDVVRDALLWAFERSLGDSFTDEVRHAWIEAYALLAALMQRGASQVEPMRATPELVTDGSS